MAGPRTSGQGRPRRRFLGGALAAGLGASTLLGGLLGISPSPATVASAATTQLGVAAPARPALDHPLRTTSTPVTPVTPTTPLPAGATSLDAAATDLPASPAAGGPAATPTASTATASAEGLEPFVALGVTWSVASGSGTGRVRVHGPDGWSAWQELAGEAGVGEPAGAARPGEPARLASEPVWVREADGWQVETPTDWSGVEVHLVRPDVTALPAGTDVAAAAQADEPRTDGPGTDGPGTDGPGTDEPGTAPDPALGTADSLAVAGSGVDRPAIVRRAAWGARAPSSTPWVAPEVRGAVVHHSVTAVDYLPADVPGILRSIQALHQDANGWTDIGYNFAVDRFGGIWEGRAGGVDQAVIGAHAEGFNSRTVGVVLLGDFTVAQPTGAALAGLEDVLAWKFFQQHTDPSLLTTLLDRSGTPAGFDIFNVPSVVGHRDLNATACPGTVEGYLPAVRSAVAARVAAARGSGTDHDEQRGPTVPAGSDPAVGDFDGDGASDVYWYGHGQGDQVWYGGDGGFAVAVARPAPAGLQVVVGDFDGDGRDDLYWHDAVTAVDTFWYGRPGRTWAFFLTPTVARTTPYIGDFDGNGTEDVLLYGGAAHDDFLMLMTRAGRGSRWIDVPDDIVPVVGDLDGDTRDDVLMHHPWGGVDEAWFGADDALFTARIVASPQSDGARRPLVGDLDADHADDIVWLDGPAAGTIEYGRSFTQGRIPPAATTLAVLADLTGGGTADLVTAGGGGGAQVAIAGVDRSLQPVPVDAPGADQLLVLDTGPDGRRDLLWARGGEAATIWRSR